MAVEAADLELPTGYLPASWYEDVALTAWIAEGAVKAASITDAPTQDAAVRAWAYYRAYKAKVAEMIGRPTSISAAGISRTYNTQTGTDMRAEAKYWLDIFNDYLAGTQTTAPSFLFARAPGRRGI